MKLLVVAVGDKLPAWADTAFDEYAKRMPRSARIELVAIKPEARLAHRSVAECMQAEATRIEAALPRGIRRVILDEHGRDLTTRQLAQTLTAWQADGRDAALILGGADGLAPALKKTADATLRLSSLTLPHALARVLLAEQLYRAVSILANHPYHRDGNSGS